MLLVSLDGFAVFGSDLILLCTTSTRLVLDNVQNLRRVRVPSLPRSPTMTKPPVRLLTHPFSAPTVLRVCVILTSPVSCFFSLGNLAWILRVPPSVKPPLALDRSRYRYSVHCWLSNALVARRCSLLALHTKPTASPGLLRLLPWFHRNLAWSVLFAFRVR